MEKKVKSWTQGEIVSTFGLHRFNEPYPTPTMGEWIYDLDAPILHAHEQIIFDDILSEARKSIESWQEEDLKMHFISPLLRIANILKGEGFVSLFEKTIAAEVEGIFLKTKTDFVIAKGVFDYLEIPYFHFQEYKPMKNPSGDVIAQLIEAMLIAQTLNKYEKPIYGAYIFGEKWNFVVMEGKNYSVSRTFICTEKDDLLQIIAILRKFKYILETRLLAQ